MAFQQCFETIYINSPKQICIPYRIDCGLGDGDWNAIEEILKNLEPEYKNGNFIYLWRKDI